MMLELEKTFGAEVHERKAFVKEVITSRES